MQLHLWKELAEVFSIKQCCLICKQTSNKLVCDICCDDLPRFDLLQYQGNLLNKPAIKKTYSTLDAQGLLAVAQYQWPLANLVTQLKFSKKVIHAKALAELFSDSLRCSGIPLPQAIIPVPLHNARFHQRKFNQALEIARFIATHNDVILDYQHCQRHKATRPQTSLSGKQRRSNIRNAFTLLKPLPYNHIAIFDDIVTTGTTVNELIHCIKQQNPHIHIDVWCICISLPAK